MSFNGLRYNLNVICNGKKGNKKRFFMIPDGIFQPKCHHFSFVLRIPPISSQSL